MTSLIKNKDENQELTRTGPHRLPNSREIWNQARMHLNVEAVHRTQSEPMSWEDLIPFDERNNSIFRETVAWAYLLGVECGRRLESTSQVQELDSRPSRGNEMDFVGSKLQRDYKVLIFIIYVTLHFHKADNRFNRLLNMH